MSRTCLGGGAQFSGGLGKEGLLGRVKMAEVSYLGKRVGGGTIDG